MKQRVTQLYAIIVGTLAVLGLFTGGHLLDIMNVDGALDATRIVLALGLIYAGFIDRSERTIQTMLTVVGVLYIGLGILGLIDPNVVGLLPSGLTGFDIAFHLLTGAVALWVAVANERDVPNRAHS